MELFYEILKLAVEKKRVIVIFLFSLFSITLLYYVGNYSVLTIESKPGQNISAVTVQKTSTEDNLDNKDKFEISVGFNLVRNGEYIVYAQSNDQTTEKSIEQSFLSRNNLSFQFKPQLQVDLAAQATQPKCIFGEKSSGYYICENSVIRSAISNTDSSSGVLGSFTLKGNSVNHLSGLLGFFSETKLENKSKEEIRFGFTDGTNNNYIDTGDLLTNKKYPNLFNTTIVSDQSKNGNFLLADTTNKRIYFYKNIRSNPKTVDYEDITGDHCESPQFSLHQEQLLIGCQIHKDHDITPGNSNEGGEFGNQVYILDISSNKSTAFELNKIVKQDNLDGNFFLTKDSVIVHSRNSLFLISREQKKISRIIYNVDSLTIDANNKITFTRDRDYIFETQEFSNESYLVARSSNLNLSDITLVGSEIFFKGKENNRNNSGYYRITTLKRSETMPFDILPYDINDASIPIYRSSYNGNNIYFNVELDSLIFPRDGQPSYSKEEFDTKVSIIKRRLERDGLDIDKYQLHFIPGP